MKKGNMAWIASHFLQRTVAEDDAEADGLKRTMLGKHTQKMTVAQSIVLALGRKALDGDKSAAEYLQRLAEAAEPAKQSVIQVELEETEQDDGERA